jgi:hypothetical protein
MLSTFRPVPLGQMAEMTPDEAETAGFIGFFCTADEVEG